jgi:site-specific DNA-methyltransferase (adenine-specific)
MDSYIWFLQHAYRVVKQDGCLISFCNTRTAETWRIAIECAGFKIRSQGVWDRGIHGMGDCRAGLAPRHDVIWMATKGRFKFPGRRLMSVLSHAREPSASTLHPTRKPVALMREIIESVVPAGGNVLDPFAGSGSTGEAAMQCGRHATLIEMEADYVREIRERTAA